MFLFTQPAGESEKKSVSRCGIEHVLRADRVTTESSSSVPPMSFSFCFSVTTSARANTI